MPMIEGKKFPYTKAGKAAAKKYAAKHEKTESKRERAALEQPSNARALLS